MITYNICTTNDIHKLYELSKNLIDTYENKNVNYEYIYHWIQNKLNNEINDYYQIIYNHIHVGYIHIINEKEIEIDDFYIFNEYQNQKIGSQVINEIINKTSKDIFLYVFIKNSRAIKFYERHGFIIKEKIKDSRYIMRLSK